MIMRPVNVSVVFSPLYYEEHNGSPLSELDTEPTFQPHMLKEFKPPLRTSIAQQHHVAREQIIAKQRIGLQAVVKKGLFTTCSTFSCTDVCQKIYGELAHRWRTDFGIDFEHVNMFVAEINPERMEFLIKQFPETQSAYEDVAGLVELKIRNVRTGRFEIPPRARMMTGGFVCTSKSKANKNASKNNHCISEGSDAATAVSWRAIRDAITKLGPDVICLENVVELKGGGAEDSDLSVVMNELKDIGYCADSMVLEALDYGSHTRKERLAIFGYRTCNLPNLHRLALVKRLVINMQIPRDDNKNKLDDFLTPEVDERQLVSPSPAAKQAKKDPDYKMEHHEIYESFNIPWPPAEDVMLTGELLENLRDAHATRRRLEAVYCCHMAYPMPPNVSVQFLDSNCSLGRMVQGTSPWTDNILPTMIGSSIPVMRVKDDLSMKFRISQIRGFEMMQFAGWDASMYKAETLIPNDRVLQHMAGNMWNAFAFAPLLGALISFVDFPCKEMPDYALDRSDNPQGDTPQGEEQFIISDSEHESDSSSSDAKDPCDASGSSGDAQELFASNLLRMAPHLF